MSHDAQVIAEVAINYSEEICATYQTNADEQNDYTFLTYLKKHFVDTMDWGNDRFWDAITEIKQSLAA